MDEELAIVGLFAAVASGLVCYLISRVRKATGSGHDNCTYDQPQRMHHHDVSRLGGAGVFIGLGVCVVLAFSASGQVTYPLFWVLIVAMPVFLVGIAEDITGKIPPSLRMLGALVSVLAASNLLGAILHLPFLTGGILALMLSLAFTCLCVAGVTNAFNIIDGLNGLAAGIGIIAMAALGWLAYVLGDIFLVHLCWSTGMVILGFMLVNYPFGKIFLGDGGAYLIGFLGAEISVLMVVRHPEVSWFFPMAVMIYPVTEVLFTMYRRLGKNKKAQHADALHLHSLVHKRMNRWRANSPRHAVLRNSISSTFFWVWNSLNGLIALLLWESQVALIGLCLANIFFYTSLYFHLIYFKTPRWLILMEKPKMIQIEFAFSRADPTKLHKPGETKPNNGVIPEPNGVPEDKKADEYKVKYAQIGLL